MNNKFRSKDFTIPLSRYKDLDDLRFQMLKYAYITTIVIIGFSAVLHLLFSDNVVQLLSIGVPLSLVALLGLYILPRLSLDYTVSITFSLMYIGLYIAGFLGVLGPGFVILILNMILMISLFFVKRRIVVLVACTLGVIVNIIIVLPTSIYLHEYLIGSIAFLSFFYAISTLIYKYQDRLIIENDRIQSKNKEIELLLKEIHHRVKNNLQTISSILYLQSVKMTDKEAKEAIIKGQHRIETMALIHKNLYQRNNLAGIEMKEYITNLVANLDNAHGKDKNIDISIEMGSIEIDIDTAIPLGLIINEVLTNSFEYAFTNQSKKKIEVIMRLNEFDQYVIKIQDNGNGKNSTKNEFGKKLIQLLTQQINAHYKEEYNDGYRFHLILEKL